MLAGVHAPGTEAIGSLRKMIRHLLLHFTLG
jgi:hypothetical protein